MIRVGRIGHRPRVTSLLLFVSGLALAGCETRLFEVKAVIDGGGSNRDSEPGFTDGWGGSGGRPDGSTGNTGGTGGSSPDGGPSKIDACSATEEICDGEDNNCNGMVDEKFKLQEDPANCGICGMVCAIDHAFSNCVAGKCAISECLPGHFDTDKSPANGCECVRTNGGVELCDSQDNNCDGLVDEGFDLKASLSHCGECNAPCDFANAAAICDMGACKMGACVAGRIDLNQKPNDGCEYSCTRSNSGIEVCDGQDNDCDGGIDVNTVDEGQPCGPTIGNVGECKQGKQTCTSGKLICLGAREAGLELCDNLDNDCDGQTDDGFNKVSDIRYCGNCAPCALAQAVPKCVQGMCKIEVCSPGNVDLNMTPGDGCEYACTFRGLDLCNGADDDCDGMTDEGINKMTDASNCGNCGTVCSYAGATGVCTNGACSMGACALNFHDVDKSSGTGCEYFCVVSGVEVCDGVDNDCDGLTDEGINKTTDPLNCGACGRVCQFSNAGASCAAGQCAMGTCSTGFIDVNINPVDGCEYQCTPTNGGVEICDGKDNDCDQQVDESDARVGANCFPTGATGCNVTSGVCAGTCAFGKNACLGGQLVCQNAKEAGFETCDTLDNDCDGQSDEDFDKQNDPRFCGGCQTACSYAHAVALCTNGGCTMGPCLTGWVDLDTQSGTGCEYSCTRDGPEVCDAKDNDCDGQTDAADSDLLYPATNFCLQIGECGKGVGGPSTKYPGVATYPTCVAPGAGQPPDWICNYPTTVQKTAPNQIIGQESWCDNLDNDCDSATDEHITGLGQPCSGAGLGNCPRIGALKCDVSDKTKAAVCDLTGVAVPTASNESCDGKDNDCDGLTDESWTNPSGLGLPTCSGSACLGVRDDLARVTAAATPFYMYRHEASRVDATVAQQGVASTRACGVADRKPWTSVNYTQAQAACAAAGMRLCRTNRRSTTCANPPSLTAAADEWGYACGYQKTCNQQPTFPYGCAYGATTCNGAGNGVGAELATDSKDACATADLDGTLANTQAALDMSGNVAEWTEDCRGILSDGSNRRIFTLRGGAYDSDVYGGSITSLRCDFYSVLVAEDFSHPTTGFRCCSVCPPGQAECSGVCRDLATHNSNCGTCGLTCGGGTTCQNGVCK